VQKNITMKNNLYKQIIATVGAIVVLASCNKTLDLLPTNDVTSATVYADANGYKQAFAKVYASYALTGNAGPAGNGDIQGIDEGTSDFLRLWWKAQELSTDEAVVSWGDPGIQDFHNMNWSASNPMLTGLYYRCYYQITLANDFIRQSADANVASKGITGVDAEAIKKYRAEARFLRAYQYSILMDLFGNIPFVTDAEALGSVMPKQRTRGEIFSYIETELKAIDADLVDARKNEYGRADKAAAWALLARLYLNAQVYTGTARNTDAAAYAKRVLDAGYSLISDYTKLMRADNNVNTSEFILTINYDGLKTQNWGGTTFLTHAPVGGSMVAAQFGVDGGWGGLRTTTGLSSKFPDLTGTADKRSQFYTSGQSADISDLTKFTDGYAITKFKNLNMNGTPGKNLTWVDIDFPIFRSAEMNLVYAEAVLRGGTGDAGTALSYVNALRTRAGASTISSSQLNVDFILDERARELYWEGFRRTDLIRYNRFVESSYVWPWKGGVRGGTNVDGFRKLYPIPSADISSNPNLVQNAGY
jgi:starch-binding outer membrane protein, SusD/RagB family